MLIILPNFRDEINFIIINFSNYNQVFRSIIHVLSIVYICSHDHSLAGCGTFPLVGWQVSLVDRISSCHIIVHIIPWPPHILFSLHHCFASWSLQAPTQHTLLPQASKHYTIMVYCHVNCSRHMMLKYSLLLSVI